MQRGARPPRERRLLDGLERIFLERGLRKVTVAELAAKLHCSRSTLYALAPSKEELFLLVLERLFDRIRRHGDQAAAATEDKAAKIVAVLRPAIEEFQGASRLFSYDLMHFASARELLERHQLNRRAWITDLIERGIREGVFRPVDSRLAFDLFLVAIRHVMESSFLAESKLTMSDALAQAEDLLLHGLLRPA